MKPYIRFFFIVLVMFVISFGVMKFAKEKKWISQCPPMLIERGYTFQQAKKICNESKKTVRMCLEKPCYPGALPHLRKKSDK